MEAENLSDGTSPMFLWSRFAAQGMWNDHDDLRYFGASHRRSESLQQRPLLAQARDESEGLRSLLGHGRRGRPFHIWSREE
jgi:hypothetical protein